MATSTPINIITGRTGTAHVSSSDDAAIWRGLVGNDNVTLSTDQSLSLDYSTKGTLVLSDGVLCVGGRMGRISNTKTVTYALPASGYYRRTILLVRYAIAGGVESMSLLTLQSDPSEDTSGADGASAAAELNITTSPTTDYILYDFVCNEDGVVSGTMQTKHTIIDNIPALRSTLSAEASFVLGLTSRVTAVKAAQTAEVTARQNAINQEAIARQNSDTALGNRVSSLESWKNSEDTSYKLVKITPPGNLHAGNQYIICKAGGGGAYAVVSSQGNVYYYVVSYNGGTSVNITFYSDSYPVSGGSATIIGSVKIIPA